MNNQSFQYTNMDILESDTMDSLDSYIDTHPNLVNLWKEYIKVKRISYMNSIIDCDTMIRNLSTNRDLSVETIVLLYACLIR